MIDKVALVNDAFYDDLKRVALQSQKSGMIDFDVAVFAALLPVKGRTKMKDKIIKAFGLAEGVTDEQIDAALAAGADARIKLAEIGKSLGLESPTAEAIKAQAGQAITPLEIRLAAETSARELLQAQVAHMQAQARDSEFALFLGNAQRLGKIATTKEAAIHMRRLWDASPESAAVVLAAFKPSATLSGSTGISTGSDDDEIVSDEKTARAAREYAAKNKVPIHVAQSHIREQKEVK